MSTSDLCQALLGQYPWKHYFKDSHIITLLSECHRERNTTALWTQSCISLNQHQHTHSLYSCFTLYCIWCQQISLSICAKALTLNPTYCTKRCRGKEDRREALERKRKVLHLVSQWMALCKDFLREDEHVKLFMKVGNMMFHGRGGNWVWAELNMGEMKIDISFQTLYRCVLDDLYVHPALEKDVRELQKLYQLHRRQWVTIW